MYTIYTQTTYGYKYGWVKPTEDHFVFRVAACSDVHVNLSPTYGSSEGYEIVIGGWHNTKSAIRDLAADVLVSEIATTDILSCNQLRWFWIKYVSNHIEVGTGREAGTSMIMEWVADHLAVDGIGMSTGYGYIGEYEYQDQYGNTSLPSHIKSYNSQ